MSQRGKAPLRCEFCPSTVSFTLFHVFLLIDSLYVHPSSYATHYKNASSPAPSIASITTLDETLHVSIVNIPDSFTSASVDGPGPVDEVSKNIFLGAFYGCTKDDHSCSWDAEITAINSGNRVVHHQPTLINSLTYWLFPMLPLTPSKVLTSSASTGILIPSLPAGAITPKPKQLMFKMYRHVLDSHCEVQKLKKVMTS